ncbi:MAG: DUF2125 domain-containing protein [Rhizobiaceae bacterium]
MPTRQSENPPPTRTYWLFRFIAMGVIIAAIGVAWFVAWNWGAGQLQQRADLFERQLLDHGLQLDCRDRQITGFPFRIGVSCVTVTSENIDDGSRAHAGAFRSAAQFYNPGKLVAELDGPARIEPYGGVPLLAQWELMHASILANLETIREFSLEAKDITVRDEWAPENAPAMAKAANAQIHARISETGPENLDIAIRGTDVFPAGEALASISLTTIMTVDGIVPHLQPGFDLIRHIENHGLAGRLEEFSLQPTEGGRLRIRGPFSLDTRGVLTARIEIGYSDLEAIGAFIAPLVPGTSDAIGTISVLASTMAQISEDDPELRTITLTIEDGNILIGFVPVGKLEPLI